MKILLIDNYDSFVYNIVGLIRRCRADFPNLEWTIVKNDCPLSELPKDFDAIILSPGPGIPAEAGNLLDIIRTHADTHPILGICLGCQAIAEVYGWRLRRLTAPRHGHASLLREIDPADPLIGFLSSPPLRRSSPAEPACGLQSASLATPAEPLSPVPPACGCSQLPDPRTIGRYHSWVIDETPRIPNPHLQITSRDEDRNIMTIRDLTRPIFGLQFHPESIITTQGQTILRNFLRLSIP